jgi:hypothetical protein
MTKLNTYINEEIYKKYNQFIFTLSQFYLTEVIEHIHKSPYVNIELYAFLYKRIHNNYINIEEEKTILTHKLMFPLVKEIIGKYIELDDIVKHTQLPIMNYMYLIRFNVYIDPIKVYPYLSTVNYELFLIHRNKTKIELPVKKKTDTNILDLNTIKTNYKHVKTVLDKYTYAELYSSHPDLTWDTVLEDIQHNKDLINIHFICKYSFNRDIKHIEKKCKLMWQAKCKIENWIFECYWNPKSTFRQKLNIKYYLESIGQSTSSTVADDSGTDVSSEAAAAAVDISG